MNNEPILTQTQIENCIFTVRGVQVMLDRDLAEMYQVETKVLNQAVKRNRERFQDDFMFQLSYTEWEDLMSQNMLSGLRAHFVTLNTNVRKTLNTFFMEILS
ncbi:ORF6N domain protein [compost metagenome]